MTYDPVTGYVVLFGGIMNLTTAANTTYSDTWIFKSGNWTQLHIPGPSARLGQYMAYDYADGYIVLFGGGPYLTLDTSLYLDDTWIFQAACASCNASWTQLSLSVHPSARGLGGMVWDPQDGYLLMYGGMSGQYDIHSDTWTFQGGQWHNLTLSVHPPPLLAPALAYDPAESGIILFGGATPSKGAEFGLDLEQTWEYTRGAWRNLTAQAHGTAPDGRILASMAYDPVQQYLVLFGGWNTTSGALYGDTWVFVDGFWALQYVSPSPSSAIIGASMISTTNNSGLFFFGGIVGDYTSYRSTNATWVFGPPPANTTVVSPPPPTPYSIVLQDRPSSNCSYIVFNNSLEQNGASYSAPPAPYRVTALPCPGYTFGGWYVTGGVTLGGPDNLTTTVDVVGNGTLTADYLPTVTLSSHVNPLLLGGTLGGIALVVGAVLMVYLSGRKRRAQGLLRKTGPSDTPPAMTQ
jgi:hypothetical protein